MLRAALPLIVLLALAGPALASPNCLQSGGPGLRVELGFSTGNLSEQDKMDFLVLEARRRGINADTAEITWLDCIKVTRREAGSWVTEYYEPYSWNLVE